MFRATLYIIVCSAINRTRQRLARLREPRYLFGAIAGFAYLYAAIFGRVWMNRYAYSRPGDRPSMTTLFPGMAASGPVLLGVALMAVAAASWLMPMSSRLLDFSRTETEILFPAPVSRQQLLVYRLMRSQLAVLVGALIFSVVYPMASVPTRVRGLLSVWLLLTSCSVFFTGVTLWRARTRSSPRSIGARLASGLPLALSVGGLAALALAIAGRVAGAPIADASEALDVIGGAAQSGVVHYVLWPYAALLRPLFSTSWPDFLSGLPAALLVYAALIAWVLLADEALDAIAEGSVERMAQERTSRPAAYRARAVNWELATHGRPEMLFVWKNLVQMMRIVDRRVLVRGLAILAWATLSVSLMGRVRGMVQVAGILATLIAMFTVLMGPQIFKTDLRQDLQHLELLKTWPVRAASIVRGEMLWPACTVTLLTWLLGVMALIMSEASFARTSSEIRWSVGLSALILAPGLVLAQFTVHNAAALIFPAWVATGKNRTRGVDAFGQRLIMLSGTLIVLVLSLIPAALITGLLWLAFYRLIGPWVLIPSAAIGLALMLGEVLLATEALGPAFERLDITSVERAE